METTNILFTSGNWAFALPAVLMLVDVVTGLVGALYKRNLDSVVMRRGFFKKIGELILLAVVCIAVSALTIPKTTFTITAMYVSLTELISIAENLHKLGVKIPPFITNALKTSNDRVSGKEVK